MIYQTPTSVYDGRAAQPAAGRPAQRGADGRPASGNVLLFKARHKFTLDGQSIATFRVRAKPSRLSCSLAKAAGAELGVVPLPLPAPGSGPYARAEPRLAGHGERSRS